MPAHQLLAAYRLASLAGADFASAQGGEVKFDPKSLSLKSSVTGLLILIISFAFFIVIRLAILTPRIASSEDVTFA